MAQEKVFQFLSLITNPLSDLHNSKWRIQDSGRKNEKKHVIILNYENLITD